MFGYYGSKSKIVNKYQKPKFNVIIEPFAGTAQYSLKYWENDIILIEKYDVIYKIWKWLQQCSKKDILELPILKEGENVDDFSWCCEEAKWLTGFIITGAPATPKKTASKWKTTMRPNTQNYKHNLIANNLHKIKHWKIILGDYHEIQNQKAVWFIDPPYQFGGEYYKYGNKQIDYKELAKFCKSRKGQVIVTENSKATWLDFEFLTSMRGNKYQTNECVKYFDNY